jgi:hypothetical protein
MCFAQILRIKQDIVSVDGNDRSVFTLSRDLLKTGFGLGIGFTGHLNTAHDYTLQFTVLRERARAHTHTHTYVSVTAFINLLVTASNTGLSPSSRFPKGPRATAHRLSTK